MPHSVEAPAFRVVWLFWAATGYHQLLCEGSKQVVRRSVAKQACALVPWLQSIQGSRSTNTSESLLTTLQPISKSVCLLSLHFPGSCTARFPMNSRNNPFRKPGALPLEINTSRSFAAWASKPKSPKRKSVVQRRITER